MGMNGPSEAGRLIGMRIAADAARRVQAEADELAIVCLECMHGRRRAGTAIADIGGRAGPRLSLPGGCQACREAAFIDLAQVRRPPVWKLEGAPACCAGSACLRSCSARQN